MKRILLDTNAYSAFKRGAPEAMDALARADEILIPVPVLAELRVGFRAGSRETANLRELEEFLSSPRVTVPSMSEQTARFHAEVFSLLKEKGKPIPLNDVWIAACSLEAGAILISYDAYFHHIEGLLVNTF
jgi:predicted nucleic acid-binding protein